MLHRNKQIQRIYTQNIDGLEARAGLPTFPFTASNHLTAPAPQQQLYDLCTSSHSICMLGPLPIRIGNRGQGNLHSGSAPFRSLHYIALTSMSYPSRRYLLVLGESTMCRNADRRHHHGDPGHGVCSFAKNFHGQHARQGIL